MRRKRTRKFTWFPVIGTDGPGETGDDFNQRMAQIPVSPNGASTVVISPLVPDVPMEGNEIATDQPGQLVQALGQEYYIERIVGKCFLSVTSGQDDPPTVVFPKVILIGCGFFVARANDQQSGGGPDTPIGSATLAERHNNYSPLSPDPIREPWMWRRVWILSSGRLPGNVLTAPAAFGPQQIPTFGGLGGFGVQNTNTWAPSALDGPHFDVKTVRRVGNDERLYFVIAARALDEQFNNLQTAPNTTLGDPNGGVNLLLDFRVLGRLTRARNRSNF